MVLSICWLCIFNLHKFSLHFVFVKPNLIAFPLFYILFAGCPLTKSRAERKSPCYQCFSEKLIKDRSAAPALAPLDQPNQEPSQPDR